MSNNLTDFAVKVIVFIDGQWAESQIVRVGKSLEFLGVYQSTDSVLPFKFQELQLVGMFIFPSFE